MKDEIMIKLTNRLLIDDLKKPILTPREKAMLIKEYKEKVL